MGLSEYSCPRCGGSLEIFDDRKFAKCPQCGRDMMIVGDAAVDIDDTAFTIDPKFLMAQYSIESGDRKGARADCERMLEENGNDPHAWLLRGYVQILGREVFPGGKRKDEESEEKPKKKDTRYRGEECIRRCMASWKRAILTLESQYYLPDYCRLIGQAIGDWVEKEEIDGDSHAKVVNALSDLNGTIDKRFSLDYTSEFFYGVYIGYANSCDINGYADDYNLGSLLMYNSIAYDPDYASLIDKCRYILARNDAAGDVLVTRFVFEQFIDTFTELTKDFTDDDRIRIASAWSTESMDRILSDAWIGIMDADLPFLGDDISGDFDEGDDEEVFGDAELTFFSRYLANPFTRTYVQYGSMGSQRKLTVEGRPDGDINALFEKEYSRPSGKEEGGGGEDIEDAEDGSTVPLDVAMDRYARLYLGICAVHRSPMGSDLRTTVRPQ